MAEALAEVRLEFPLRWVYGAVRRSGEITEYEVPGFGWLLDVSRYLEETLGKEIAGQVLEIDESELRQYPAIYWLEERKRLALMRADTNWDRWARYMTELSVPGESGMELPELLVDVDRQVLFIVPDREILPMRLEQGIPDDWGWRTVNLAQLRQIMSELDYAENILSGASNQVAQATLRRAQRIKPVENDIQVEEYNRVKAMIRRRLSNQTKGGTS